MTLLGYDNETGIEVHLTAKARKQSTYIIGSPGSGKTTLLKNIAYQDMTDSVQPACLILDPHGDFSRELLAICPKSRQDDVIYFAPGQQAEQPQGLNILACDRDNPKEVRMVISTVISTLRRLFATSWGPRMDDLLRRGIATVMYTPGSTLLDLYLLLSSEAHREKYIAAIQDNPILVHFWQSAFATYTRSQAREVVDSSLNKLGRFLSDDITRNTICQPKSTWNMRQIFDEGKILICNLSKGDIGEDNAALIGSTIVNLALIAILSRSDTPEAKRHPVHAIVDEYQSWATESFPVLQSEARKYRMDLVLAHQYRDQLDLLNKGSTMNVSNFIVFRVSGRDSLELASQFDNTPPPAETKWEKAIDAYEVEGEIVGIERGEAYEQATYNLTTLPQRAYSDVANEMANSLTNLPDWTARVRLIGNDGHLHEYDIQTLPPQGNPSPETADYIRQNSLSMGTPREEVEAYINTVIGDDVEFDRPPMYDTVE